MTLRTLPAAALLLALYSPSSFAASIDAPARVIVKFKADASVLRKQTLATDAAPAERARTLAQRTGLRIEGGHALGERSQVVTGRGIGTDALAARLAQDSEVEYAVPDRRKRIVAVPNDPLYAASPSISPAVGQWYLRAPDAAAATSATTIVSSINAAGAWDITTGHPSVVVAVLDTGVRFEHPDLRKVADGGNYLDGYDFVSDVDTANDGNGRDVDASDPGDWIDQADIDAGKFAGDCTAADISSSSWHGTETSALIGAMTDNGVGMASVGRHVRILPVRVLGKCGGFDSDIVAGMRWAAGIHIAGVPDNPNPAKVINMSLGGGVACSAAYRDAIAEVNARGAVVVASAGNSAGHAVGEPANCPGAIGVAGLRHIGTKVGFSDIGPEVAIAAPGGNCLNTGGPCVYPILTARNTGAKGPVAPGYSTSSVPSVGTSFSAPLVAGTAALMLTSNPALTPTAVRDGLRTTARAFPTTGADAGTPQCVAPTGTDQVECYCTTSTCGAGMLDARAAVASVATLQSRISAPTSASVGDVVTFDASLSSAGASRAIVSRDWVVLDAGSGVLPSAPQISADGLTLTATPAAAGQFTIQLTVTDDLGATATSTASVTVAGTTTPSSPQVPPSDGGGGGGALSPAWLLALLGAIALLRTADRRRL